MSLGMVTDEVCSGSKASNEPWATSLEKTTQVSMVMLQVAATHQTVTLTSAVIGDSYRPNTYQIHQWGRKGEGEKAQQMLQKANCTTSHGWNAQTLVITTDQHCIGLVLTLSQLHLATYKCIAKRLAWWWCLRDFAVVPGQALSLEPQALSRARRYPW